MMKMSTTYEQHGRTAQKQRTRAALVAAAREIVGSGGTPTVEAAADAAMISRTTAYRYFSNQRALLAAAHPVTDMLSLLPANAPSDPEARVELVVKKFLKLLLHDEQQQRTMLRLSLEPAGDEPHELPLRQGRAIGWLTEALEPARVSLGDEGLKRLVLAIRSTAGIEAFVWLVDVAGLSRQEAVKQMRWSVTQLCRGALTAFPR
jgi:AcrR family transcriptional regulator